MRELKFRIWDNLTNEMHYDALVGNCRGESTVPCVYLNEVGWAHTDNCVVEQFTGLYDKNGKEIYEGDIIKKFNGYGSDNGIAKIEYDTATFDLGVMHEYRQTICGFIAKAIDNPKYNSESSTQSFYEKECEVIGNIHDKKEIK